MNLEAEIPLKYYLNLGCAEERRRRTLVACLDRGLEVERWPAIAAKWATKHLGQAYAKALTRRLALRAARQRHASAVLLLDDDVEFHTEWEARMTELKAPQEWDALLFGSRLATRSVPAKTSWVRVPVVRDFHALALKAPLFSALSQWLKATGARPGASEPVWRPPPGAKVYAAWPNLIWTSPYLSEARKRGDKPLKFHSNGWPLHPPDVGHGLAGLQCLPEPIFLKKAHEQTHY